MKQRSTIGRITTPEQIIEMGSGFQKSRILLTAFELDIFNAIGSRAVSKDEVARAIDANPKATERLLNVLCALGFLDKRNGRFSNADVSLRYLVKESEEYLSRIGHMLNLYRTWGTLTEAVRKGTSVTAREYDAVSLVNFIDAMHQRAKKTADKLISYIDLDDVSRVLDVGGGSGIYSMAFAKANKNINAVVFDLPMVTKLTKKYIMESCLADRITTMNGDFNKDDFGNGYDLIFMSAIVHINSPEQNKMLIEKAYASLNPEGRIVIQDHIMEDDRTAPLRGAIFSLNMLVNTQGGDTYTENEMCEWLEQAGCVDIRRIVTDMENDLIVGKRSV